MRLKEQHQHLSYQVLLTRNSLAYGKQSNMQDSVNLGQIIIEAVQCNVKNIKVQMKKNTSNIESLKFLNKSKDIVLQRLHNLKLSILNKSILKLQSGGSGMGED